MISKHAVFEPFDAGQALRSNVFEAPKITRERVGIGIDALTAQVFEQVIVRVDTVERRMRRVGLIEIPEQVVHKMRQRFRRVHGEYGQSSMVQ